MATKIESPPVSQPSASPDAGSTLPAPPPPKQSKGLACIFCQQRKVKCDRKNPCNTCTKARVQCQYRTRRAPRRKEARATEVSLRARLGRLEELLKTAVARNEVPEIDGGDNDEEEPSPPVEENEKDFITNRFKHSMTLGEWIDSADAEPPEQTKPASKAFFQGRMFTERGKSRYIENKLWSKIYDEVKDAQEILDEESSSESEEDEPMSPNRHDSLTDDLVFGSHDTRGNLQALYPTPANMSTLWVAFTENVNPLNHIVHVPSTQPLITKALSDTQSICKADIALLFAIWLGGVSSLDDHDCRALLGEPRAVLLRRYKLGTQKALLNANYLRSSNLNCLRAFILYLLAVRPYFDSKTFWATAGIAVRIAQRLGIHKDGALFNLPPFETEMRRRLWWQIIHIDVRASEVAGAGIMTVTIGDIKRPLNVNDEDMWPDMQSPPIEHEGPTEMCFVLLRCSIGRYFRFLFRPVGAASQAGVEYEFSHPDKTMDQLTGEFETYIQDNFLTNADPLIPIQFFTAQVARAIICSWKVLNALRRSAEKPNNMSSEDRDILFEEALKGIEYDNLGHTDRATQRFMWHIASHFQWHSLVTLLHELRTRTRGELVERAWAQIAQTYKNRPEMLKVKNPLHAAIGRLTMAAWRVREDAYTRSHKAPIPTPEYINTLRSRLFDGARDKSTPSSLLSQDIGSMSEFSNMATSSTRTTTSVSDMQDSNLNFNLNSFTPNTLSVSTPSFTNTAAMSGFTPDIATENWFNTPLEMNADAGIDPGQMDWNMWGTLLQDYELPMDGTDFVVPTPQTTNFGARF